MRRTHRLLITAGVVLGLTGLLSTPALAAGSFGWTATFTHYLKSRTYTTPHAGTHTITTTAASTCPGPGSVYEIRVVHEEAGPDTFYAWKKFTCGVAASRQWTIPQTGNFHFDIQKSDTNDTTYSWHVVGTTFYP
jgi:hypothetical protein